MSTPQSLLPHQLRVVDEKAELDAKLSGLRAFINASPLFSKLGGKEQGLLVGQSIVMGTYSAILGERIEGFKPAVCTVPPAGWWCSRPAGHEGPCAAREATA